MNKAAINILSQHTSGSHISAQCSLSYIRSQTRLGSQGTSLMLSRALKVKLITNIVHIMGYKDVILKAFELHKNGPVVAQLCPKQDLGRMGPFVVAGALDGKLSSQCTYRVQDVWYGFQIMKISPVVSKLSTWQLGLLSWAAETSGDRYCTDF